MDTYNVQDPYGTYQTKSGEDPYSILMKMASWNQEIRSTISDVQYNLDGTIEKQTQIIQNVDGITSNVFAIDTRVGKAESTIVQQATLISQRVTITDYTGAKVTSLITQDAASISLLAQRLNLNGLVTFTNLSTSGQTTISGGNISTNTLRGNAIIANTLYGDALIANTLHGNALIGNTVSGNVIIGNTIAGDKIMANAIGANHISVNSLAAISADLGTIYSGTINGIQINGANINIYETASIGAGLYLRGSGNHTGVYFGSTQIIQNSSGWLDINSGISSRGAFTEFYGSVDFSGANVTGLGGGGATSVRYSSSSRRLYVDLNGVQQGWINLDG